MRKWSEATTLPRVGADVSQFGLLEKSRRFEWRLLALKVHSTAHVSQVLGGFMEGESHMRMLTG